MRVVSTVLAVGVAAGSIIALRAPDVSYYPDALAAAALDRSPPDAKKAVQLYLLALQGDLANPNRWADLGSAYHTAQDTPHARYCYHRALELSGQLPSIWLRDANFHFDLDEPESALRSAARVLKTVPDYDAVLFGYFDRFGVNSTSILSQIGNDRRATRAYTQHLLETRKTTGKMDEASHVWNYAFTKGMVDAPLAKSYLDAMLVGHHYAEARRDWVRYLGRQRGDYPDPNLLFNGGFEKDTTGVVFDWQIQPSLDFDTLRESSTTHDGSWALQIKFHGNENVSYAHVIQKAFVPPGRYVFQAWIRTGGITTNEGPRIEISDPESPARATFLTDPFLGSIPWKLITIPLRVQSGTNLLAIRIVRHPSSKFDNKIGGSFWLDSVRLVRE